MMIFAGAPEFGDEEIYFLFAIWTAILLAAFVRIAMTGVLFLGFIRPYQQEDDWPYWSGKDN